MESGAQGGAAGFTHFDFGAPLSTLAQQGVHASIGKDGMEGTMAREAAQSPSSAAIKGPVTEP